MSLTPVLSHPIPSIMRSSTDRHYTVPHKVSIEQLSSSPCCRVTEKLMREKLSLEAPLLVKTAPTTPALELSNLDQLYDYYNSAALFYPPPHELPTSCTENVAQVLRVALEGLLSHFPWAAGRLHVNPEEQRLEVEGNGKGVQFVAGHADLAFGDLGDVSTPHPAFDLLFARLRDEDLRGAIENRPLVALQVTRFKCGGFVLSIISNHTLMDGYGAAIFLQNLCSIARGAGLTTPIDTRSRRQLMKPRSPPLATFAHPIIIKKTGGELSRKWQSGWLPPAADNSYTIGLASKFTFGAEALNKLRRQVLSGHNGLTSCSRFVALAALLWKAKAKSLLEIDSEGGHHDEQLPLGVAVNVREKIVPSFTRGYMGNAMFSATAKFTVQELCEKSLGSVAAEIKHAIGSVTPEYVQSHTDHIELLGIREASLDNSPGFLSVPSMVGLPFYDTDCGWGKPLYFARPSKQFTNRLIVMESVGGDGSSWDVLAVFSSEAERLAFQEGIKV